MYVYFSIYNVLLQLHSPSPKRKKKTLQLHNLNGFACGDDSCLFNIVNCWSSHFLADPVLPNS